MSSYLAYSYSSCLSKEEEEIMNEKVSESRKEFSRGVSDGFKICLTVQSLYSLTTRAAYASDQCPNSSGPAPAKSPSSAPRRNGKELLKPKPGFKPLTRRQLGASTSASGTICAIAIASGDYLLGGACMMLVFVFLNIVNRN